jgi:5-formyltetrahydrofolate cyclo-ligase
VVPLVAPVESNGPQRHLRVAPFNSPDSETPASERAALRRDLRRRRAEITAQQRTAATRSIALHVARTRWLQGARPIGLYVSVGHEVDTRGLLALAARRRCPVYLPRICDYRAHRMQFVLQSSAPAIRNRHGIPEPDSRKRLAVQALSVVFLPLLGFDARGTRIGSGAGYYDRALSFRRHRQRWHRPLIVGVAFRCQELPYIEPRHHDVPLDALVTEDGVTYFSHGGPSP